VARLGGDEFVVVCEDLPAASSADAAARRIAAALADPFPVADRSLTVAASIGVALSGVPPTTAEVLLGRADVAMYRVKRARRTPAAAPAATPRMAR
jgi:diguanylate cyclase (GGDEF)-like protein